MINRLILISLLALIIFSCSGKIEQEDGFTIKGRSCLDDGTKVELFDTQSYSIIDSAYVKNGQFEFSGKLEHGPTPVFVTAEKPPQYKWLWLENKPMVIDCSGLGLEKSKITGSEIQLLAEELSSEMNANPEEIEMIVMRFILEHPDNVISASMLSGYSTSWGKPKVTELYESLSKEHQEGIYGREIKKYIEFSESIQNGDEYVDFAMEDTNGNKIKLSDNLGKVTLLEFWSSSCGPCRLENPNLVKTYDTFRTKGFEIFAVSLDRHVKAWKKAIAHDGLSWTHVSDLENSNKAMLIYGVNTIPDNFLINENNEVIGRNLRGEELSEELGRLLN
ncbi:TlpA disulfide reductase family protein [Neolewinella antarctica]|uniref:Peroxiredoxin n=1 Tax=Neolewinella antarctica TaxID=442734 RepID=A0ABX0XFE1_9BACT|nr:TlpA disulfide reductase family protein [Neolewinella antarctica]NJC27942.1 peroxiredoxin [Neolewinella antarctica]